MGSCDERITTICPCLLKSSRRLEKSFVKKERRMMTKLDTIPVEPKVEPKKERGYLEEMQVMGEQLLTKVKELLHEGNVRRIIIKSEGRTVMEFPLTVGVVSALAIPQLVAIGAISGLLAQYSIEVVRSEEPMPTV
jgi:hypothetical protein